MRNLRNEKIDENATCSILARWLTLKFSEVLNRVITDKKINYITAKDIDGKSHVLCQMEDKILFGYIIRTITNTFYYDFVLMESNSKVCFFERYELIPWYEPKRFLISFVKICSGMNEDYKHAHNNNSDHDYYPVNEKYIAQAAYGKGGYKINDAIMYIFRRYGSEDSSERNVGDIQESLPIINSLKNDIDFSFIRGQC